MDFTEPFKHSQGLTLYSPNGKYLASYHLAQEGFARLHPSSAPQVHEDGGLGVIVFRMAATLEIVRVIELRLFRDSLPTISELGWSPDSAMLLAACPSTGMVLVWSMEQEEFVVRIEVPGIGGSLASQHGIQNGGKNGSLAATGGKLAGLNHIYKGPNIGAGAGTGAEVLRGVRFSADSRHVLVWEEHLLRMTIWSIESRKLYAVQHPKAMIHSAITSYSVPPFSTLGTTATTVGYGASASPFSTSTLTASSAAASYLNSGQFVYAMRADLQYVAIGERRDCKDYVSIHATEHYWTRPAVHSFPIPELMDLEGVVWSPDGRYLVMWENPTLGYKLVVYTMEGGKSVGCWQLEEGIPGTVLGVKSVCWHPGSKLLAVGGYDQKIRMFNYMTWTCVLEFHHTASVNYGPKSVLWRETDSTVAVTGSVRVQGGIEYSVVDQPAWLPTIRIDTQKANAKIGVGWCDFNADGTLFASRNDNMPNVLWIWSLQELKPIVIIQQHAPIRISRWDPGSPSRIVWCCGTSRVYSWQASESVHGGIVEAIEVPADDFEVSSLRWCPDGKGLLLVDKDMFCLGFPIEEDEQYTIHENTASIFSKLR